MLSFVKLVDLGSVAPHVCVMCQNIWDWLSVDCLIVYSVIPIASHICFHQKSTTLAYVPEVTVTLSTPAQTTLLYREVYFFLDFFSFTVFDLQCFILLYNICVCHLFNIKSKTVKTCPTVENIYKSLLESTCDTQRDKQGAMRFLASRVVMVTISLGTEREHYCNMIPVHFCRS